MKGICPADRVLWNTRTRHVEFVARLQIQPEFWRCAERVAQQDCRFPGDTARAIDDFGNAIGRHADRLGKPVRTQPKWNKELLFENLSWMNDQSWIQCRFPQ